MYQATILQKADQTKCYRRTVAKGSRRQMAIVWENSWDSIQAELP